MALHQSCNSRPAFPKFDKDALKFAKKKMKKLKRLKSHTNLNKSRMGLKSYRSKILENEGVLAKISLIQPSTSLGKDSQQRLRVQRLQKYNVWISSKSLFRARNAFRAESLVTTIRLDAAESDPSADDHLPI